MKKFILMVVAIMFMTGLFSSDVTYSAPEFMQAYYDAYSQNYINTLASGRGNTGVAKIENLENVLLNPAGFSTDHSEMYVEFSIKPEKKEIGHLGKENYLANNPFTFIGFSFNMIDNLSSAIYYSMPKSIEYVRYTISLEAGTIFDREPQYHQYSLGFANSYKISNLRLGFNAIYNIHSVTDMFINGILDKTDIQEEAFSFNTGLLYTVNEKLNLGLAYNHSSELSFDTQYWDWDVTVPARFSAGLSYTMLTNNVLNFDYERRMNSQMSEDYDDLDIFKLGYEKRMDLNTVRFGAMYIPSTFSGEVILPYVDIAEASYPQTATNFNGGIENILSNEQTFLTIGYSLDLEEIKFNLSAMQAVASELKTTQLSLSVGINLSDFDITKYTPKKHDED